MSPMITYTLSNTYRKTLRLLFLDRPVIDSDEEGRNSVITRSFMSPFLSRLIINSILCKSLLS